VREQTYVLLLALSYAALASLHLVLLTTLRVRRAIKVAGVVAMSALYIATFYWAEGLLGWSAAIALPDRFKLIAVRVVEPDLLHKRSGAIHLWVEAMDDRNIPSGEPRAFLLPYSPQLASKVSEAGDEIKKGHPQGGMANIFNSAFGNTRPGGASVRAVLGGASSGGDPSGGGMPAPSAVGGQSGLVNLVPLPPPLLPPKEAP
jgi:hypothetical protein